MNKKASGVILVILLVVIAVVTAFFAKNKPVQAPSGKIQVVTSFYPLYFFAKQIGGEYADVSNITPPGTEPHDHELTAQDIVRMSDSKLLILNGVGLEAWGDNVKQNIDASHTLLVVVGEGLASHPMEAEDTNGIGNILDPHIWLSPSLAKTISHKIAQGFMDIDPQNKGYYESTLDSLKIKLDDLDNEYKLGLGGCPEKIIITSHAAFGYLASSYGLKQIPIAGLSPDAEPSPKELGQIADFARNNNIKYIFFESFVSPKLSETIASEVGAKTLVLNPIEGLTSEEISDGKDYFSEMRSNLYNLKIALQCKQL